MDERGLELVRGLIAGHIDSALRGQPKSHSGRGARLFDLHRRVIEQAEATVVDVEAKLQASDDDKTRRYAERALHRTLTEVETILPFLRPLMESVRRDDVPIDMLVALDSAIEALLPAGADPVVHFDDAHMYSTLDLYEALSWPQESEPTPVAFFVPVLSPFNALMTPLLVHEIGHTAILQANLGSSTMSVASDDLNTLLAKHLSDADPETRFKVQTHLVSWVDELLCDSLATAICGPGYLFAAASFLPATAHDDPASSHPFPSDRLRFSLASLDSSGWSDFMAATCPETVGWLRQRATPRTPTSGQERFLREACEALAPAIESTVANHVSEAAIGFNVAFGNQFIIHPGQFLLGSTLEYLRVPRQLAGQVLNRSSWARTGLLVATAVSVHPGFTGALTLELVNSGTVPLKLITGSRICQLVLWGLDQETSQPYPDSAKYDTPLGPQPSRLSREAEEQARIVAVGDRLRGLFPEASETAGHRD